MTKRLDDQYVEQQEIPVSDAAWQAHLNSSDPHPNYTAAGVASAAFTIEFDGVDLFDGVSRVSDSTYVNSDRPIHLIVTHTGEPVQGHDFSVRIYGSSDGISWIMLSRVHTKYDGSAFNAWDGPSNGVIIPPNWYYKVVIEDFASNGGSSAIITANWSWYEMKLGAENVAAQGITRKPDIEEVFNSWPSFGTALAIPHTYNELPVFVEIVIRAKVATNGYQIGEELPVYTYDGVGYGEGKFPWSATTSNIYAIMPRSSGDITIQGKSGDFSFASIKASLSNWQLVVKAWFANGEPFYNVPVGTIQSFGGTTAPNGYFICDGAEKDREQYKGLFDVIGTSFGVGNGTTTFNLPDLRGQFLRGLDPTGTVDPDGASRTIGSVQADDAGSHEHYTVSTGTGTDIDANAAIKQTSPQTWGNNDYTLWGSDVEASIAPTSPAGTSTEVRPTNVAVNYIIKYAEHVHEGNLNDHIDATNAHPFMEQRIVTEVTNNLGTGEVLYITRNGHGNAGALIKYGDKKRIFCISSYGGHWSMENGWGYTQDGGRPPITDGVKEMSEILFPNEDMSTLKQMGGFRHSHAFALFENGNLYTWGYNVGRSCCTGNGQTRIGWPTLIASDIEEVFDSESSHVSDARYQRLMVRKTNGTIWGGGDNANNGALGLNTTLNYDTLQQLTALGNNVRKVWNMGANYGVSVAQLNTGEVYVCGRNNNGQLGLGNVTNPIRSWTRATAWEGGQIIDVQGGLSGNGFLMMHIRTSTADLVKVSGYNGYGTIGNGTTTQVTTPYTVFNEPVNGIKQIAVAGHEIGTCHVLKIDGTYWNWGYDNFGQCGRGSIANARTTPVLVMSGINRMWGNMTSQDNPHYNTTFVEKTNGELWATGYNNKGYVGNGTYNYDAQTTFVKVAFPNDFVLKDLYWYQSGGVEVTLIAISDKNKMYAWGSNFYNAIFRNGKLYNEITKPQFFKLPDNPF